jgi:hypothetical protein
VQIIAVLELPANDFCRIRVSLLSRKLMNDLEPRDSLLITLERASRERLMFEPSLSRKPSDYVLLTPSEPARSTKLSYDSVACGPLDFILILNTVCDLDEASFSFVSATFLASSPISISRITCAASHTTFSDNLFT